MDWATILAEAELEDAGGDINAAIAVVKQTIVDCTEDSVHKAKSFYRKVLQKLLDMKSNKED